LFLSFLLGALDDRPLLKRNASERVCKNRHQAIIFLPPLLSTWRYVLCCWCCHRTSNSRRLADHTEPRKLHVADKAAELVGLAKVNKAVSIIYTPQYLTSHVRLTTPCRLSTNLTSLHMMKTNLMTYLVHCHDPSQPYEIIDEHADYHYELSSSNFNLINMSSQTSPGMATAVERIQPGWT
jgi:hypothetical protein